MKRAVFGHVWLRMQLGTEMWQTANDAVGPCLRLKQLIWLAQHPEITNEPVSRQLIDGWDWLETTLRQQPHFFGEVLDMQAFEKQSKQLRVHLDCREPCLGQRRDTCASIQCDCRCTSKQHKRNCRCRTSMLQHYGSAGGGECLAFCTYKKGD